MAIDEKVNITATADTNQALTALQQIDASLQKIAAQGAQTQAKVDTIFDKGAAGAMAMAGAVGIATTAAGALSMIVSQLGREWDNVNQKQKAATDAQLSYADASRRMANQLHDFSFDQANARVMQISKATGVPAPRMALAMEGILGSMGAGQSDELAFRAGEAAAKFRPGALSSADEAGAYGQGIVEIRKNFKDYTTEQAAAAMSHMMRLDRSETAFAFTRNVLPGILARKTSDSDTLESLATLPIVLGQISGDRTGKTARSASVGMDKQLDEAVIAKTGQRMNKADRDRYLLTTPGGEEIRRNLLGPYFSGGYDGETADELSPQFQALAERLTGSKVRFHGEAKQYAGMIQLLDNDPNNNAKRVWAATQRDMGQLGSPQLIADFNARESAINRSPYQQAAISTRAIQGVTEQAALGNQTAGVNREELQKLLQQAGVSGIAQTAILARYDKQRYQGSSQADAIEAEINAVQSGIARFGPNTFAGGMPGDRVTGAAISDDQKRTNALLEEVIRTLRSQKIQVDLGDGPTERGQVQAAQRAGQ